MSINHSIQSGRATAVSALVSALSLLAACGPASQSSDVAPVNADSPRELAAGDLRKSGVIDFDVTCRPEVARDFETAVALLHSFFYDEARRRFEDITKRDPECAMAWWGIAMTWYHPLWAPPTLMERGDGLEAAREALAVGGKTELERGLIDAIHTFYITTEKKPELGLESKVITDCSCCGIQAHGARARAFHDKLEALHARFPDNVEVTVFYALAMLGTVDPTDKTYARQREAAGLLEPLFEQNPDHPGIAHYIIHAYDYPELASRALTAARRYDDIAPWVPHALHMPTHIYTRLGMWNDSIDGNIASSTAARDHAARHYEGSTIMDDLHAMDYLMFAYLQTAQDERAQALLDHLDQIEEIVPGNGFASAYAAAAMPARFALERRDWKAAAELRMPVPHFVNSYPMAVAHVEFARAVGASRIGDKATARGAVERLEKLHDSIAGTRFGWWTDQVEIQRLSASGWLAYAEGRTEDAKRLLSKASELEDAAGTHPVTPGQILPAREQLGDMLLETGDAAAALGEYERSLRAFPRRFRSYLGAIEAAHELGDRKAVVEHCQSLLEMAGETGDRKAELARVRKLLADAQASR